MTAANREDELSNLTETSLIVFLKHNKTNLGQGYINFTKRMNDQTKKVISYFVWVIFGAI
jgi:hypothetical protein